MRVAAVGDKGDRPRPLTATSRAQSSKTAGNAGNAARNKTPYPIPGDVGYYQRADVKGRIKKTQAG